MPTHTEHDAAIEAGYGTYPDPPAIEPYELADDTPNDWPAPTTTGPFADALDSAIKKSRASR